MRILMNGLQLLHWSSCYNLIYLRRVPRRYTIFNTFFFITLIIFDQPHLVSLKSAHIHILGVVPSACHDKRFWRSMKKKIGSILRLDTYSRECASWDRKPPTRLPQATPRGPSDADTSTLHSDGTGLGAPLPRPPQRNRLDNKWPWGCTIPNPDAVYDARDQTKSQEMLPWLRKSFRRTSTPRRMTHDLRTTIWVRDSVMWIHIFDA